MNVIETEVLVIGGGVTGTGVMRDLALRGVHCVLIDRKDLCGGASGGNHGLLHSGARYVSNDREAALECRTESEILKKIAPECIENTGAFFVATGRDDEAFAAQFPAMCSQVEISCESVELSDARFMESHLTEDLQSVYLLPDATVDPFRLALENVAGAGRANNSVYRPHTEVISFAIQDGRITSAACRDNRTGEPVEIVCGQVVNAGGAWAMNIARLAGCNDVNLLYSKGTLMITNERLTSRVIHRLRPPGDGDILVPGGTVSVLGTTSVRVSTLDNIAPTVAEVDRNISEGSVMLPVLSHTRFTRAFAGVRPLIQPGPSADDRSVTRGFTLVDHEPELANFCTITGGKLTTYRLMAEKTADLVADRLNVTTACKTKELPLSEDGGCQWTEPGAAPKYWFKAANPDDTILCECEMVPQSAIDEIIKCAPGAEKEMTLEAIALRSRAGKGPCQGSFCSIRIGSYLYDRGYYTDEQGLLHMKDFLSERFKGLRSIVWGAQTAQMELAEALHCGLLGLDKMDKNQESS